MIGSLIILWTKKPHQDVGNHNEILPRRSIQSDSSAKTLINGDSGSNRLTQLEVSHFSRLQDYA